MASWLRSVAMRHTPCTRHYCGTGLFNAKKSTKELSAMDAEWPTTADAYELLEDCGRGVSATVYRAYCKKLDEVVAVKIMNLEAVQNSLDEIVHEAQLMKNYHHPNVLPLYTSFVHGIDLWLVVPFVSGGSVLHIIKYTHPDVRWRGGSVTHSQGVMHVWTLLAGGMAWHACMRTSMRAACMHIPIHTHAPRASC